MQPDKALKQEAAWLAKGMISVDPKGEADIRARYFSYVPSIGRSYTCPKCWMTHHVQSALRAVEGTDEYDVLRCNRDSCSADIVVPFE